MAYPALPYPGYSWSMNHHMGKATEKNLYALAWAAETFKRNRDPINDIDNYLIANKILTANIRKDTRQASPFRDYQQIPSELGLLISRQFQEHITLTPIGLAFVEKTISHQELMTLQVLRYQYPNGHRVSFSNPLRAQLRGTEYDGFETLTELQATSGIQIRPAVLIWQVLRGLQARGESPTLMIKEVERFLVPCLRHTDSEIVINNIISSRQQVTSIDTRASRDTQEWFRFLLHSPIFAKEPRSQVTLRISDFGLEMASDIDEICQKLEDPETFWIPNSRESIANLSWYAHYSSIDLSIKIVSMQDSLSATDLIDITDDEREIDFASQQSINLRPFDSDNLLRDTNESQNKSSGNEIISYEASLSKGQHILHDSMIMLIADVCRGNGGEVFDDPQSVDLLVGFQNNQFIIEVKSVTPRNFAKRLRLALGQLLHYDYLCSLQSNISRRKVVAVTAKVPSNSWYIPFLNSYLDFDLLSLGDNGIELRSNFALSHKLFSNMNSSQTSLF